MEVHDLRQKKKIVVPKKSKKLSEEEPHIEAGLGFFDNH